MGVQMRGADEASGSLFSYVDLEEWIPLKHLLRKIPQVVPSGRHETTVEF
jgi:hypothetical protein